MLIRTLLPLLCLAAAVASCDRSPTTPSTPPPTTTPPPAPTVASVVPATGSADGGTSVVITGTDFSDVRNVTFGGRVAVSWRVDSTTSIAAIAPSGTPGGDPAHVVVQTPGGASATGDDSRFQWVPNPLTDLVLSASSVTAGMSLTGTVTITFPAPGGGVRLPLRWTSTPPNSTAVLLPTSVLVPADATSGSFQITTFFVSSPEQIEVSSDHWGETRSATFTITP
jgi:hypothetical protein